MEKLRKENKRQQKEIQRLKDLNAKLTSELAAANIKLKVHIDEHLSDSDVGSDGSSDSDIEIIEMVDGYEEFSEKRIKTFKKLDMTPEVDVHKILVDDPLEFVAKVTTHKDKIKVRLPKRKSYDKVNNNGSIDIVDLEDDESDDFEDDGSDVGWTNTVTTKRQRTIKKKNNTTTTKKKRIIKKKMNKNKNNEEIMESLDLEENDSGFTNTVATKRQRTCTKKMYNESIDIIDLEESESDSCLTKRMATKKQRTKVRVPKKKTVKKVKKESFDIVDIEESNSGLENTVAIKRRRTKTAKVAESDHASRQSESDDEKDVAPSRRSRQSRASSSSSLTGRLSPGRSNLGESDLEDKFDKLFNLRNETLAAAGFAGGNMKKQLDAGKHLENKIKEIKENKENKIIEKYFKDNKIKRDDDDVVLI